MTSKKDHEDPATATEPQYIFTQRREGVAVTLNVQRGDDPQALFEEYAALVDRARELPGYTSRKQSGETDTERRGRYARSRR